MNNMKNSKKSPAESFADMVKEFGSSIAEIFNDPNLSKKAREFGQSAVSSAKAFTDRFKDEEVKNKFKEFANAAKVFGESVVDYFKEEKKEKNKDNDNTDQNINQNISINTNQNGNQNGNDKIIDNIKENKEIIIENESKVDKDGKSETNNKGRSARITGYIFAIAWNIIFLIFFNFFNNYIAYYKFDYIKNSWTITPLLTDAFNLWLPILNICLAVSIIGNIILIINDSFYFDNITNIVMNLFGISVVTSLLKLFPINFGLIPYSNFISITLPIIITIVLILIIIGLSISVITRVIKVIFKLLKVVQ